MAWRVITVIVVFLIVVFSFSFMFQNLPINPVVLTKNYIEPERVAIVEYGAVPVFIENLRFNHNAISYSIDENCDVDRRNEMIEAFRILEDSVARATPVNSEKKLISFFEVSGNADILVGCSNNFVELGEDLFAAGEGGPSRIINTRLFRTIEEGKVLLYNSRSCEYPIVALHELGHVFGFDHSDDPKNIMYNTSDCEQRLSDDMVDLLVELYSIKALSDAKISKLDAVLSGKYLSFNISVLNEGMLGIDHLDLTILSDGDVADVVELGELEIGYGRTLRVENMRVPGGSEVLTFVVDADDLIRELDEENNAVEMRA